MVKDNFKISIITPSFNSGECIERAIKSVLAQDYQNFEHIIVDGGSKDNTVEILKKYKHLKWVSEQDNGQADAMNKGFLRSTGDVIVYLNADDYFFSGAFSKVIEKFNNGAKFVVGNVLIRSPRLNTEFLNVPRTTLSGMLRHWEPNAFCHNPVGYFYKREIQEKCPFNVENYATMDLEFLLEAASVTAFEKVEFTLGCFEDGKDTKTGITQANLDYWQNKTFPYIKKHLDIFSEKDRMEYEKLRRTGYSNVQAHMNKLNKNLDKDIHTKELPLISVIIPTFNCEAYICRAVDSILEQGLKNLEIIIVDDASSDDTQNLLKVRYQESSFVNVVLHRENKKLGAARNTGLDLAQGKYIFFLDADDWLEKNALFDLVSIAEKYNSDIVACGVRKVWGNGHSKPYHSNAFACKGGTEALCYFGDNLIGSIVWNKLYSRELIEKNKIRFVVPYWHEDVMFTAEAVYYCKNYISINNEYCNYFQRDNSIVNTKPTPFHLKSYINLYIDMSEFIKKILSDNKKESELCRYLMRVHCSGCILPNLRRYVDTRTKEEWEKECWNVCTEMLGVNGFALADFLIHTIENDKKMVSLFSLNNVIQGRLRQPIRKVYYAISGKKINEQK